MSAITAGLLVDDVMHRWPATMRVFIDCSHPELPRGKAVHAQRSTTRTGITRHPCPYGPSGSLSPDKEGGLHRA
jgi:hypothetical protein